MPKSWPDMLILPVRIFHFHARVFDLQLQRTGMAPNKKCIQKEYISHPSIRSWTFCWSCALYVVQNFERKILYPSFLSIEISTWCFLCTRLLADIGGNMGLFLGCSVLTVFEFVDLLIRICATSLRRKDSKKMKSKDTHLWFIIRKWISCCQEIPAVSAAWKPLHKVLFSDLSPGP